MFLMSACHMTDYCGQQSNNGNPQQPSTPPDKKVLSQLFCLVCYTSDDRQAICKLLDKGLDKNLIADGSSTLALAVQLGRFNIADELLRHGTDPNLQNQGTLPLFWAVATINPAITELLLNFKANPNKRVSWYKETPLEFAEWLLKRVSNCRFYKTIFGHYFRVNEVVELLRK